jgi:DNA invertase Pin-like site-specific DNA recombinase
MEDGMIIGYARVSTDGQSLESQEAALRAAGAERVYAEKISGAVTDRKALARAIAALGPAGDVLLVTRLDRLARSTRTYSIPLMQSARPAPASGRLLTTGPTQPRRTAA